MMADFSILASWTWPFFPPIANLVAGQTRDIKEKYDRQLKELQEVYGLAMLELRAKKKASIPAGHQGQDMIFRIHMVLRSDRVTFTVGRLLHGFEVPIEAMIDQVPAFRYRTVAGQRLIRWTIVRSARPLTRARCQLR